MKQWEIHLPVPKGTIDAGPDLVEGETIEHALEIWGHDYDVDDHPLGSGGMVTVRARERGTEVWRSFDLTGEFELNLYIERTPCSVCGEANGAIFGTDPETEVCPKVAECGRTGEMCFDCMFIHNDSNHSE